MFKLTTKEYEYCRQKLANYRYRNSGYNQSMNLAEYPFYKEYIFKLFKLQKEYRSVCMILGRHLVLKIVDELLDDGKEEE